MKSRYITKLAVGLAALYLSGCSTVKLPDLDLLKMSSFFDEVRNVEGYPKISDAPAAPTDIRSDTAWDTQAKNLLKMRDGFSPERLDITIKSDEDFTRDVEALKARVRAYKADDPQ